MMLRFSLHFGTRAQSKCENSVLKNDVWIVTHQNAISTYLQKIRKHTGRDTIPSRQWRAYKTIFLPTFSILLWVFISLCVSSRLMFWWFQGIFGFLLNLRVYPFLIACLYIYIFLYGMHRKKEPSIETQAKEFCIAKCEKEMKRQRQI